MANNTFSISLAHLLRINEGHPESGEQESDCDARPHGASANDSDRFHLRRRARGSGDSERRALRQKEVPPGTGLLRLDQLLGGSIRFGLVAGTEWTMR